MLRLTLFALGVSALVSCERSNRTIEVQPTNPSVKPSGDNTDGGDTKTKTGSLTLMISGLPSSASSAQLAISISGDQESAKVTLTGGSGSTTLSGQPAGYASVKVSTTIGGTYYSGSASASIVSNDEVTASVSMTAGQDPGPTPPGPTPPGPTPPGPTPPGPGGDSSIIIVPDIGGNPGPTPNPSNTWDGKTFKGNSMFNVDPVN